MDKEQAKEFLKKTITVVGKDKAVDDGDEAFLKKYATVVGSVEAIETVCGSGSGSGSGSDSEIEKYTISWMVIDGTCETATTEIPKGQKLGDVLSELPSVTPNEECEFLGWIYQLSKEDEPIEVTLNREPAGDETYIGYCRNNSNVVPISSQPANP